MMILFQRLNESSRLLSIFDILNGISVEFKTTLLISRRFFFVLVSLRINWWIEEILWKKYWYVFLNDFSSRPDGSIWSSWYAKWSCSNILLLHDIFSYIRHSQVNQFFLIFFGIEWIFFFQILDLKCRVQLMLVPYAIVVLFWDNWLLLVSSLIAGKKINLDKKFKKHLRFWIIHIEFIFIITQSVKLLSAHLLE